MELGLLWIVMAINSVGLIVLGCVSWISASTTAHDFPRVISNLHDRMGALGEDMARLRDRVDALENRRDG